MLLTTKRTHPMKKRKLPFKSNLRKKQTHKFCFRNFRNNQIKKRATPAGGCSPIAVKTVSKRYKRRGSICAISYGIKKRALPNGSGNARFLIYFVSLLSLSRLDTAFSPHRDRPLLHRNEVRREALRALPYRRNRHPLRSP